MSEGTEKTRAGADEGGTVLVLGATGKTGRRLVPRLRMRGATVRAASRSSRTRFDWADPGVGNRRCSGRTPSSSCPRRCLRRPVRCTTSSPGPRVAACSGSLLSGHGADSWGASDFGRDMRSAEDAVRFSALEWTVLRSADFDQNFDEELFHAPLLAGELVLPAGVVPELTFAEAVELIARACELPVRYRQISVAEDAAALRQRGLDRETAHDVSAMCEVLATGALAATSGDVAAVLGPGPRAWTSGVRGPRRPRRSSRSLDSLTSWSASTRVDVGELDVLAAAGVVVRHRTARDGSTADRPSLHG